MRTWLQAVCACGWRGVPTFLRGVAQSKCPACRIVAVRIEGRP